MHMNSRNTFRLWIIGTALFVISVSFLGYRDVQEEFDELAILRELKGETVVPVLCGEARGIAGEDYTNNQEVCWYAISRFRVLYPEHNEQSDEALARKLYAARGVDLHFPPPPKPWTTMGFWASIAIGIPLMALVLAACLVWAFSCTARRSR
jgi:hypothetical protein